jgi:hypothetical protein
LPESDEAEVELEQQYAMKEIPIATNMTETNLDETIPVMENPTGNEANHPPVEEEANNNTANEADVHGRIPGQLPTAADVTKNGNDSSRDYATVKQLAKERVAALVGTSVTVGSAHGNSITWKVAEKHVPPNENIMDAGFDQKKKLA